jgi:hypothetical protein
MKQAKLEAQIETDDFQPQPAGIAPAAPHRFVPFLGRPGVDDMCAAATEIESLHRVINSGRAK